MRQKRSSEKLHATRHVRAKRDRKSHGLRGRSMLITGVVAVGLLGGSTGASVAPRAAVSHAKKIKPDFNFYRGQTITFLANNTPGISAGLFAQTTQNDIANYLHATVNVVYNGTGSGYVSEDQTAASPNDGLTIGTDTILADFYGVATGAPPTNFDLTKQEFIAGYGGWNIIVSCPGSPFSTWQQLINNKSIQYNALSAANFGHAIISTLGAAYNLPLKPIDAYSTASAVVAGCLRGDGAIASGSLSSYVSLIEAGTVRPLMIFDPFGPSIGGYAEFNADHTVAFAPWLKKHEPATKSGRAAMEELLAAVGPAGLTGGVFAPAGTPPARVLALTDAFRSTLAQANVISVLSAGGGNPRYYSATTCAATVISLYKHVSQIQKFLNYSN